MANQLGMDKSLAIKQLRQQGLSQRPIAIAMGFSRGAVVRRLKDEPPRTAKVQTGEASSNSTKVQTGSTVDE